MKFSFLFHLLEDEEVFPIAEVLHAGDAMCERVLDGEFVAFASLFGSGWRDDFVDEILCGFANDAGGFAAGVQVDRTALRRLSLAGDAGGGERSGIGDSDVAIDAIKKREVIASHFIEILARGQDFIGPESVVPVAACEPVACGRGICCGFDFREHVGEGFDAGEIDVKLGAACASKMRVRVIKAREDEGAGVGEVEIAQRGFGSCEALDVFSLADGEYFAATDGDGFDNLRLVFSESNAGVDDTVEEDDVRRTGDGLGNRGRRGIDALGCDGPGRSGLGRAQH